MWTEIPGSPDFHETAGGGATLTRMFKTAVTTGSAEAASQGYAIGNKLVYQNRYMEITSLRPINREAYDLVTVAWSTTQSQSSLGTLYREGRIRKANDEEWSVELSSSEVRAEHAVAFDSSTFTLGWGLEYDEMAPQPSIHLIWQKWLNKNTAAKSRPPTVMPQTKAKALDMLQTYIPQGVGTYEVDPPQIMFTLDNTDLGKRLLCLDISLDDDGDLVVRTARFKYNRVEWNAFLFGIPA